jgi:hypothetical protein
MVVALESDVCPVDGAILRLPRFAVPEGVLGARVRVLRVIAERFSELGSPEGRSGERGSGERFGLMPHEPGCLLVERADANRAAQGLARCSCAYRSVAEFERLLLSMRPLLAPVYAVGEGRRDDPRWVMVSRPVYAAARLDGRRVLKLPVQTARWHLVHWWIRVDRVQKLRTVERRSKSGKKLRVLEPVMEVRRHADADLGKALLAVEWMAREWSAGWEPRLPDGIGMS